MSEELDSSELGSKDYWVNFYKNELDNYKDHGEPGEIWFGLASVRRVVNWIKKEINDSDTSVLDLGCGNGLVLVELAENGFTNLSGVDYSQEAVELATAISKEKGYSIVYEQGDLLDLSSATCLEEKYNILIDKGTYDAISLNFSEAKEKRLKYIENCHKLLATTGFLIITSCNWTSQELTTQFCEHGLFSLKTEIPVKQFSFGGSVGQTVCCLIFQPAGT